MKKESNAGLFFLLAVGIVGLGLFYGASDSYADWEIGLYHGICWLILLIALLRMLELVWQPLRQIWDQAWGKGRMPEPHHAEYREQEKGSARVAYERIKHDTDQDGFVQKQRNPESYDQVIHAEPVHRAEEESEENPAVRDAGGRSVIIMPDRGARYYLGDQKAEGTRQPVSCEVQAQEERVIIPEQMVLYRESDVPGAASVKYDRYHNAEERDLNKKNSEENKSKNKKKDKNKSKHKK